MLLGEIVHTNNRKRRRTDDIYRIDKSLSIECEEKEPSPFMVLPDISCSAVYGNAVTQLQLSSILSNYKAIVLFFYACDFTPTAQSDIKLISSFAEQFGEKNAYPIAISTDTDAVHHAFIQHPQGLGAPPPFPLVSDSTRTISRCLDALDADTGVAKRSAFIIDKQRQVRFSFILNDPRLLHPVNTILSMLNTLDG